MYPASSVSDLSAVDTALKSMEMQVQMIKDRLREEADSIPKAKQKRLQNMSLHVPSYLPERMAAVNLDVNRGNSNSYSNPNLQAESFEQQGEKQSHLASSKLEPAALPKHVEKGQQIYVCGRLICDTVESDDGKQKTYSKVVVQQLNLAEKSFSEMSSNDGDSIWISTLFPGKTFSSNGGSNASNTVELWQAFFANPLEWWDNRQTKMRLIYSM